MRGVNTLGNPGYRKQGTPCEHIFYSSRTRTRKRTRGEIKCGVSKPPAKCSRLQKKASWLTMNATLEKHTLRTLPRPLTCTDTLYTYLLSFFLFFLLHSPVRTLRAPRTYVAQGSGLAGHFGTATFSPGSRDCWGFVGALNKRNCGDLSHSYCILSWRRRVRASSAAFSRLPEEGGRAKEEKVNLRRGGTSRRVNSAQHARPPTERRPQRLGRVRHGPLDRRSRCICTAEVAKSPCISPR